MLLLSIVFIYTTPIYCLPIPPTLTSLKSVVSDERSVEEGECYFDGGVEKIASKVLGVITIEYLHKLSASIPQKIMAVIEEVGGHTKS